MVSLEEIVDIIAEHAKQDPGVRKVIEDVRLFDGLREHPGWRRLYGRIKEDRERFLISLARRLMHGEKVSDEEIAFQRGFYQGAEWVLGHPEKAEEGLERAARQAWAKATVLELISEEEAPYA